MALEEAVTLPQNPCLCSHMLGKWNGGEATYYKDIFLFFKKKDKAELCRPRAWGAGVGPRGGRRWSSKGLGLTRSGVALVPRRPERGEPTGRSCCWLLGVHACRPQKVSP